MYAWKCVKFVGCSVRAWWYYILSIEISFPPFPPLPLSFPVEKEDTSPAIICTKTFNQATSLCFATTKHDTHDKRDAIHCASVDKAVTDFVNTLCLNIQTVIRGKSERDAMETVAAALQAANEILVDGWLGRREDREVYYYLFLIFSSISSSFPHRP